VKTEERGLKLGKRANSFLQKFRALTFQEKKKHAQTVITRRGRLGGGEKRSRLRVDRTIKFHQGEKVGVYA